MLNNFKINKDNITNKGVVFMIKLADLKVNLEWPEIFEIAHQMTPK